MTRPAHNACAVKHAANGTLSAQYEYGPFGEFYVGVGLGGGGTVMLPVAAAFSPRVSVSYSIYAVGGKDPKTKKWFCGWCDSGAVTVMGGAGFAVNVSAGPIVTAGPGGFDQLEGPTLAIGVGAGIPTNPTATTGVEISIDYANNTGQVTNNWPALSLGLTGYVAVRVTGSCTGCTPGMLSVASGERTRLAKIRSCLAKVQQGLTTALGTVNGKTVQPGQAVTTVINVGSASEDTLPE